MAVKIKKRNAANERTMCFLIIIAAVAALISLLKESKMIGSVYTHFDASLASSYHLDVDDNVDDNNTDNIENINDVILEGNRVKHNSTEHKTKKPWLVHHVGPPKTATTTIQEGLEKYAPYLASTDNVFYMGQTQLKQKYFPYEESKSNTTNMTSQNSRYSPVFYAIPLLTGGAPTPTMQWHLQEKHNVVVSSEMFVSRLSKFGEKYHYHYVFDNLYLETGDRDRGHLEQVMASKPVPPADAEVIPYYRSLRVQEETKEDRLKNFFDHDVSADFGFDVKVVVTYRHYFQWLASYYYQRYAVPRRKKPPSLIQFVEKTLDELGEKYHIDEAGFDFTNKTELQALPSTFRYRHGTLYAYLKWSAPRSLRYRLDIFDMHQQQLKPANATDANETNAIPSIKPDVFRDFICQALPDAPSTCSRLHEHNNEEIIKARARKKPNKGNPLETGELSDTQFGVFRQKAYQFFPQINKKETSTIRTYENVTEEDFKGLENLAENFKSWVEWRGKRLKESGEEDDGHRWLCLSEESKKKLRNVSWNMLRQLEALVRFREEATKDNDDYYLFKASDKTRSKYPLLLSPNQHHHEKADYWEGIKRDHDDMFEIIIESGAYCELDYGKLFADDVFVLHVFYGKHE